MGIFNKGGKNFFDPNLLFLMGLAIAYPTIS